MVYSRKFPARICNAAHAIPLTEEQIATFRKFNNDSLRRHGLKPVEVA